KQAYDKIILGAHRNSSFGRWRLFERRRWWDPWFPPRQVMRLNAIFNSFIDTNMLNLLILQQRKLSDLARCSLHRSLLLVRLGVNHSRSHSCHWWVWQLVFHDGIKLFIRCFLSSVSRLTQNTIGSLRHSDVSFSCG